MSPSQREREYARRRYEKWQANLTERQRRAAILRRRMLAAGGAVAAVLVVVGVFALVMNNRGSSTTTAEPAASSSSEATASAAATGEAASPSAAATSSALANNPCATPTVSPAANPKSWTSPPPESDAQGKTWTLVLDTTCGPITIQLDGAKAPKAVASTLFLAKNDFWNGSPCHRLVTEGIYVLQCGDPTGTGTGGPGYSYGPVENAPAGDLYKAGVVAMARQGNKGDSMGSQFFLVYKDSTIPSDSAGGYSVIGTIVGGMDVVEKVAAGGVGGGGSDGAPLRKISLVSATATAG